MNQYWGGALIFLVVLFIVTGTVWLLNKFAQPMWPFPEKKVKPEPFVIPDMPFKIFENEEDKAWWAEFATKPLVDSENVILASKDELPIIDPKAVNNWHSSQQFHSPEAEEAAEILNKIDNPSPYRATHSEPGNLVEAIIKRHGELDLTLDLIVPKSMAGMDGVFDLEVFYEQYPKYRGKIKSVSKRQFPGDPKVYVQFWTYDYSMPKQREIETQATPDIWGYQVGVKPVDLSKHKATVSDPVGELQEKLNEMLNGLPLKAAEYAKMRDSGWTYTGVPASLPDYSEPDYSDPVEEIRDRLMKYNITPEFVPAKY